MTQMAQMRIARRAGAGKAGAAPNERPAGDESHTANTLALISSRPLIRPAAFGRGTPSIVSTRSPYLRYLRHLRLASAKPVPVNQSCPNR